MISVFQVQTRPRTKEYSPLTDLVSRLFITPRKCPGAFNKRAGWDRNYMAPKTKHFLFCYCDVIVFRWNLIAQASLEFTVDRQASLQMFNVLGSLLNTGIVGLHCHTQNISPCTNSGNPCLHFSSNIVLLTFFCCLCFESNLNILWR